MTFMVVAQEKRFCITVSKMNSTDEDLTLHYVQEGPITIKISIHMRYISRVHLMFLCAMWHSNSNLQYSSVVQWNSKSRVILLDL